MEKFYAVSTGFWLDDKGDYKQTGIKYYQTLKEAQTVINKLFKRCYPKGFNSSVVTSPKYNDLEGYLESFTTEAMYHYELLTFEFEG